MSRQTSVSTEQKSVKISVVSILKQFHRLELISVKKYRYKIKIFYPIDGGDLPLKIRKFNGSLLGWQYFSAYVFKSISRIFVKCANCMKRKLQNSDLGGFLVHDISKPLNKF